MNKKIIITSACMVIFVVVAALFFLRCVRWEYNSEKIDSLAKAIIAEGKPTKLRQLLEYPQNHYVDGEFSYHYVAALWTIEQRRPGLLKQYRNEENGHFIDEAVAHGAAVYEQYYPKREK